MSRHYTHAVSDVRSLLTDVIPELRKEQDERARWIASKFEDCLALTKMVYNSSYTPEVLVAIKEHALSELRSRITARESDLAKLREEELKLLGEWEKTKNEQMDAAV